MHRSGTSSLAGVAAILGAAPPNTPMPADGNNSRGYWESMPLYRFHDELLRSAGSSWDDWRRFDQSWYTAPETAGLKNRAKTLLAEEFDNQPLIVMKDPRICRFAPFWLEIFREIDVKPHVIIPVRSPLEVARSLTQRNEFTLTKGLLLWLRHMLEAEAETRSLPRSIVMWKSFLTDWHSATDKISEDIGLSWPRLSEQTGAEIDEFLGCDLRHHVVSDAELARHPDIHEWTMQAYRSLCVLARQPGSSTARAALKRVRDPFEKSCDMFGRVTLDGEMEIERLGATLVSLRGERDHWAAQHQQAQGLLAEVTESKQQFERALAQTIADQQQVSAELAAGAKALAASQNLVAELVQSKHHLQASLDDTGTELVHRTQDLEIARNAVAELSWSKHHVQARLDEIIAEKERIAGELAQRTGNLEAARESVEELARSKRRVQTRLDEIRVEKERGANELAQRNGEIDALRGEVQAIVQSKQQLEIEGGRASAENARIAADLADVTREAFALRVSHAELQRREKHLVADAANSAEMLARQTELNEQTLEDRRRTIETLQERAIDAEAAAARVQAERRSSLFILRQFNPFGDRRKRRLRESGLFDPSWYRNRYSDILIKGQDPLTHYIEEGFCNGLYPNPLFDTRWYLRQYPDVRQAGINPLLHYVMFATSESRDPNPYFSTRWYLDTYNDVAALHIDPLLHYLRDGAAEGRDPGPCFRTLQYLEDCSDARTSGINPLAHFIHYGRPDRGARARPSEWRLGGTADEPPLVRTSSADARLVFETP